MRCECAIDCEYHRERHKVTPTDRKGSLMATTTKDRRNSARKPGLNVTNDAALLALVQEHKRLKQIEREAAEAERKRKGIEADLRAAMGDEEQIVVRGVVIARLSSQRQTQKIDRDTLKNVFPEAWEATVSYEPYRFIEVL